MSNNYSPDADDQIPEKKSSQQMLLLLLMLLIVLFGYLYFFTGLIKPRGEQPKPQPVAETTPVKSPLPPRPEAKSGQPAKPAAAPAAKTAEQAAAPAAHPATPAAPGKPAAVAKEGATSKAAPSSNPSSKEVAAAKPAAGPKAAPAVKAAPAAPKPATVASAAPAAQVKPAKPAGSAAPAAPAKGAAPATPAKGAAPGSVPAKEAKSATANAKKPESQSAAKTAAAQKPKTVAAQKPKTAAKPASPAYHLEVDGDLAESEVGPVLAKLKQAGIAHVVKIKTQKGEPMHRLFLADFANRDEASEELERLKLAAPNAFMLKENARYAVYAGSYLREAKAANEQSRLLAKGVQLLLRSATAPVAVFKVHAGAFADQAGAERAAKTLKKAGLSAKVAKLPKSEK